MILDINDLTKKKLKIYLLINSVGKNMNFTKGFFNKKQIRHMKRETQFLVNYSQTDKITLNGIDS